MLKTAFTIAISVLGVTTFALAQEPPSEDFLPVGDGGPWYLQQSTCSLAHNDEERGVTTWFRISMGTDIEFADPNLSDVNETDDAPLVVAVDEASEETLAQGISYEDSRRGYRMFASPEFLDRLAAGRRMEVGRGRQAILGFDLTGADRAVVALRACYDEAAAAATAMDYEANITDDEANITNAM